MNEEKDHVKFKCHWCGEILKNGLSFTLECDNCHFCSIKFDRAGEPVSYIFNIIENGKEYRIEKPFLSSIWTNKEIKRLVMLTIKKHGYYEILFKAKVKLEFEDGVPQVSKMLNKFKIYNTFS